MAKAAPEGLITALDIGTSKVSAMIAQKGDGGELIVLGTGQRVSRGVKRGYIADMAATEVAVREAVEQAERIAGINIENVWAGFSAGGLVSDEAFIEVATWSDDERYVATGAEDNTARVWDAATGQQLALMEGHTDWIFGVDLSPDAGRLATGSACTAM